MARRIARPALVALLVLLVGAAPLGAVLTGTHEIWVGEWVEGGPWPRRVRVVVHDDTGLVRSVSSTGRATRSGPHTIVVEWLGGCGDYRTDLTVRRDDAGYVVSERTAEDGCPFLVGYERAIALHLALPIDPGSVLVCTENAADPRCYGHRL